MSSADASSDLPLDHILGTAATVRVLRELSDEIEHAPPHIAAQTGISRPAVREALLRLEDAGVIERVGQGRNVLYRLADKHPLTRRLIKLFKAEAKVEAKAESKAEAKAARDD